MRAGVPHGHWKTTTFVAGLSRTGMIAPWVLDGPMNGDAFTTYVTRVLVPELSPGNVVIMDNLSSHKAPAVRAAIEAAGARLLFLPPYSPDFNPIEMAFSKQGTPAKGGRADHPRPLGRHRPYRRPLLAPGMLELFRSRWLRCRLIRNRSSYTFGKAAILCLGQPRTDAPRTIVVAQQASISYCSGRQVHARGGACSITAKLRTV